MPPFIALAVAGVGVYAGLKWLTRESQPSAAERASEKREAYGRTSHASSGSRPMPKDLGTLEWDATTGVYRPRKETVG